MFTKHILSLVSQPWVRVLSAFSFWMQGVSCFSYASICMAEQYYSNVTVRHRELPGKLHLFTRGQLKHSQWTNNLIKQGKKVRFSSFSKEWSQVTKLYKTHKSHHSSIAHRAASSLNRVWKTVRVICFPLAGWAWPATLNFPSLRLN